MHHEKFVVHFSIDNIFKENVTITDVVWFLGKDHNKSTFNIVVSKKLFIERREERNTDIIEFGANVHTVVCYLPIGVIVVPKSECPKVFFDCKCRIVDLVSES